jgi:hypothetical protein
MTIAPDAMVLVTIDHTFGDMKVAAASILNGGNTTESSSA